MADMSIEGLHTVGISIQRQDVACEAALLLVAVHALCGANLQIYLATDIGTASFRDCRRIPDVSQRDIR